MTITLDQIVEEVSLLPDDVSAEVVERILIRRQGGFDQGVEESWKAEAASRVQEIVTGQVEGIPLEDSLNRAARHLARSRIVLHPEADEELAQGVAYYASIDPGTWRAIPWRDQTPDQVSFPSPQDFPTVRSSRPTPFQHVVSLWHHLSGTG